MDGMDRFTKETMQRTAGKTIFDRSRHNRRNDGQRKRWKRRISKALQTFIHDVAMDSLSMSVTYKQEECVCERYFDVKATPRNSSKRIISNKNI